MEEENNHHLQIPLPLAELLHVTLGPLALVLEAEDHRWAELVQKVLEAYRNGRDDALSMTYGPNVAHDGHLVTVAVAEQLSLWVEEMGAEAADFELWKQEFE